MRSSLPLQDCTTSKKVFHYNNLRNVISGQVYYYETEETDHGRMERRRYWVIDNIDGLTTKDLWTNLNTVGLVKSVRTVDGETPAIPGRSLVS
jgi:hypothetical protein